MPDDPDREPPDCGCGATARLHRSPARRRRSPCSDIQIDVMSTAELRWLWPTFSEVILSGVSGGVMIILFVIMLGVRS